MSSLVLQMIRLMFWLLEKAVSASIRLSCHCYVYELLVLFLAFIFCFFPMELKSGIHSFPSHSPIQILTTFKLV